MRTGAAVTTRTGTWETVTGGAGEERAPVSLRSRALVSVWISHGLSQLEAVWQGIPEAWLN